MGEKSLKEDPKLIDRLAVELQARIGILPFVKPYAFHLTSQPSKIRRVIYSQPQSYSEIARLVRASRSLKLLVRACGHMTGGELDIYGGSPTLLINCSRLADRQRIEIVQTTNEQESAVRVLAGVGLEELTCYLAGHSLELYQTVDSLSSKGTVIGAIAAGSPGVMDRGGGARGGCLADEVLAIRIVDCHGDLVEYDGDKVTAVAATLGLVGVIYDATLRCRPVSLSRVQCTFHTWSELLENDGDLIRMSLEKENIITQLIYLPYNSCTSIECSGNNQQGCCDLTGWSPYNDEVMLRTVRKEVELTSMVDVAARCSSGPRKFIHLLDPVHGPHPTMLSKAVEQSPGQIPRLIKLAHENMRRRHLIESAQAAFQYTAWAVNALGKITEPFRSLSFTMETDRDGSCFEYAFQKVLSIFSKLGDPVKLNNHAFNLGLRIEFTSGTHTSRLLGLGFNLDVDDSPEGSPTSHFSQSQLSYTTSQEDAKCLVHFNFAGLLSPGPCTEWIEAAEITTQIMMFQVPRCTVQWKSEWYGIEDIIKRYRGNLCKRVNRILEVMGKADRDGVFLTESLKAVVCPKATNYQRQYREERSELLEVI